MSKKLLPMFSSRIFEVLGLTFRSLIYFEFILVWVKKGGLLLFFFFAMYLSNFPIDNNSHGDRSPGEVLWQCAA